MTEKGSNAVDIPGWHLLIIVTLLVLGPVSAFMVSGNGDSDSSSARHTMRQHKPYQAFICRFLCHDLTPP